MKSIIEFFKSIIYHTPNCRLDKNELEQVKENGLVHFCNQENASAIINNGVKGGLKRAMRRKEKGYTWFYIYNENELSQKIAIIHSKGERSKYNAYINIKGLTEEQLGKLRIRREIDDAVIFPGTMRTDNMINYQLQ